MQLDLLGMPFGLQGPMMSQDFMNNSQNMTGAFGIIRLGILWRRTMFLNMIKNVYFFKLMKSIRFAITVKT